VPTNGAGSLPPLTTTPLVSVVIPTYNRRERLQKVLCALAEQTCPLEQFEVIVVSDGSTDATDDYLLTARPPFTLVVATQPNSGPAVARNRGVELARSPLVLFIDDDVVATPTLVEEHLGAHRQSGGDAVVIGPMITPPDFEMRPWVAWEQAMLYKQYAAMNAGVMAPTSRQFYTGNVSLVRARFVETGGFDARFRRAEDVELSYRLKRAGVQFVWNPRAIGYHYADRSFDSWLRTARDYGVNDVVFCRDHGQDPTFTRVRAEFRGRNPFVRWLARACVAWPALEAIVRTPLRALALHGAVLHASALSRLALSGLFNVSYYGGMATALGGGEEFRRVIVGHNPPSASSAAGR
jgi:glycosyltransferase involved in cell wall biosynthesis